MSSAQVPNTEIVQPGSISIKETNTNPFDKFPSMRSRQHTQLSSSLLYHHNNLMREARLKASWPGESIIEFIEL